MHKEWSAVLQTALEEGIKLSYGLPVTGASLRQLVAKQAGIAGLDFPPDPKSSFGSFLNDFPEVILVQRRPGKDMLIVPAERPELLTANDNPQAGTLLRSDIFWALTHIPAGSEGLPYYLPASDTVVWLTPESAQKRNDAVVMPGTTTEQERADRQTFVTSAELPEETRSALNEALESKAFFANFTGALRAHGQARAWHRVRTGLLLQRLKSWSETSELKWQSAWLQEMGNAPSTPVPLSPSEGRDLQEFLAALGQTMIETDMARISVPLDLVLRAWNRKSL